MCVCVFSACRLATRTPWSSSGGLHSPLSWWTTVVRASACLWRVSSMSCLWHWWVEFASWPCGMYCVWHTFLTDTILCQVSKTKFRYPGICNRPLACECDRKTYGSKSVQNPHTLDSTRQHHLYERSTDCPDQARFKLTGCSPLILLGSCGI